LAKEIKNTETLTKFKKKLIDFLIEEWFYSVEEFLNYWKCLYGMFNTYNSISIMLTLSWTIYPLITTYDDLWMAVMNEW
jgi:hypothetical protein